MRLLPLVGGMGVDMERHREHDGRRHDLAQSRANNDDSGAATTFCVADQ